MDIRAGASAAFHGAGKAKIRPMLAPAVRPTVINNQPLPGWHRQVVLAGALMSPFDATVWHWPPDERERPLRSAAEVREWLAGHPLSPEEAGIVGTGKAGLSVHPTVTAETMAAAERERFKLFNFSPQGCLAEFPEPDGGPESRGHLPPSQGSVHQDPDKFCCRDFWIEECRGYKMRRYFNYESREKFMFEYGEYLCTCYTHIVVGQLADMLEVMKQERIEADEAWRRRKIKLIEEERELVEEVGGPEVEEAKQGGKPSPMHWPTGGGVRQLQEKSLSPECINILYQCEMVRTREELLECPHIQEPIPGVFTFPIFRDDVCQALNAEMRSFAVRHPTRGRPRVASSNIDSGVLLDEAGFTETFLDPLITRVLRPIARLLLPQCGGGSLDQHRSFTMRQSPGRRTDGPHAIQPDDGEVSVQVSLSEEVVGGDLVFHGVREMPRPYPMEVPLCTQGVAVLYDSRDVHRWKPLAPDSPERTLLVLWARSSSWSSEYVAHHDFHQPRDSSYLDA